MKYMTYNKTNSKSQKCFSLPIWKSFVLKNITDRDYGPYWNKRDNNIIIITSQVDATCFGQYPTPLIGSSSSKPTRRSRWGSDVVANTSSGTPFFFGHAPGRIGIKSVATRRTMDGRSPAWSARARTRRFEKWKKWEGSITLINPPPTPSL